MMDAPLQEPRFLIPRALLEKYFGRDPRLLRAFELQAQVVAAHDEVLQGGVAATSAIQDASVVTLSPNATFTNEFLLTPGDGISLPIGAGTVTVKVDSSVARASGHSVQFAPKGDVNLGLPSRGVLLSTLDLSLATLVNAANDVAANSAGVPIGGLYHNAGALRVRLT